MGRKILLPILTVILILIPSAQPVLAQTYSFSLDQEQVDVFWESNGTVSLDYTFIFTNDTFADPLDFVDVGLPTDSYSLADIAASIDGHPITDISHSPYVDGVALGLGNYAIQPGQTGMVRMSTSGIGDVLYEADQADYASAMFAPTWFGDEYVHGATNLIITFHLPPGVQPDEPRWFEAPKAWPHSEPVTGYDSNGRITYTWQNANASGSTPYTFGAAFPEKYVPGANIQHASFLQRLGLDEDAICFILCVGGFISFFILIIVLSVRSSKKRKLQYLPPKISIEGMGIKRGLTAIESAILLQIPLDRILTMILFSTVKKGAAKVISEDPLQVKAITPQPENLKAYEVDFLTAIVEKKKRLRDRELQKGVTKLVKSVQKKMKGFSLKETKQYYQAIVKKAWQQVETAETPQVRSERYSEGLEWAMLDRDFDDRTRRVFHSGPVFVPIWWSSYSPSSMAAARTSSTPRSVTTSTGTGGRISLPTLPGSTFAASIVSSVQNTAGGLVSNLSDFTSGVTKVTNPVPKSSSSGFSRGGGSGCACACACAGCACACAGGGR